MPPVQLTSYKAVPSGMSFDLDVTPVQTAYLLSTPGNEATVALQGSGVWSVEVLASLDGTNFTQVAVQSVPGQWRYDTKGAAAAAIRVLSYTSGALSGMLAHGGLTPITNVSALFGSFLIFSYNSTPTEPPGGNQIRFNARPPPSPGRDRQHHRGRRRQSYAIRHIPNGGTLGAEQDLAHRRRGWGVGRPSTRVPTSDRSSTSAVGNLTAQQVVSRNRWPQWYSTL